MSRIVLTAAEMRSAEAQAIAAGTPVENLMERAGLAAAEAIWRFAGPLPALVLCGPGNNGGDGYVIARALSERGMKVRVAAFADPKTDAACAAKKRWDGTAEPFVDAAPAHLLIDALFGTGLGRALDQSLSDGLKHLASTAQVKVAIDLPSGVATDDGTILSPVPDYDLTITFQTLKPAHLLQPAARHMGRIVVADIGIAVTGNIVEIGRPKIPAAGPDDHKYRRGHVGILGGEMAGAAALTASAAARAGAGYVSLAASENLPGVPRAVVQSDRKADDLLSDSRVGAVAIGPGLGRGADARRLLDQALAGARPLILDADALTLLAEGGATMSGLASTPILTPHEGEFSRLFPGIAGSKLDKARLASVQSQAIIVYKGADTIVAAPDGRIAIARPASSWLATAGTGDILTGIVAAMRATRSDPFEAACAAVWLHGRAAERAGSVIIADDLLDHLAEAVRDAL